MTARPISCPDRNSAYLPIGRRSWHQSVTLKLAFTTSLSPLSAKHTKSTCRCLSKLLTKTPRSLPNFLRERNIKNGITLTTSRRQATARHRHGLDASSATSQKDQATLHSPRRRQLHRRTIAYYRARLFSGFAGNANETGIPRCVRLKG